MAKQKAKPTSIRPRGELLEKIDSVCEKLDCSRNDYINTALESAISEDVEEQKPKEEPKKITLTHIGNNEPFRPSKGVQLTEI